MEVSLKAAEGQDPPGDTFVSLRIGDIQKQSRFAKVRNYSFPHPGDGRETFCRLEVFRRVGHRTISFANVEDGRFQDVEVPCDIPGMNKLSMSIAMSGAPMEPEKELKGKAKVRKDVAQKYLADNKLEEALAKAMRKVIQTMPENPYNYLSEMILQIGNEQEIACELTFTEIPFEGLDHAVFKNQLLDNFRKLGSKESDLLKFTINLREGSTIAEIKGPASAMTELKALPLEAVEVMGSKAKLTAGFPAQRLTTVTTLTPGGQKSKDAVRIEVKEKFQDAVRYGYLPAILKLVEGQKPDMETERLILQGELIRTSRTGRLAATLEVFSAMDSIGASKMKPVIENSIDARQQDEPPPVEAKSVAPHVDEPPPIEAKAVAPEMDETPPVEAKAVAPGVDEPPPVEAKAVARGIDEPPPVGAKVVAPLVDEPADLKTIREKAQFKLIEASQSGKLADILAETSQVLPPGTDTMGPPVLPGEPTPEEMDIESIRKQAKAALVDASNNGTLSKNLTDVNAAPDEVDALRSKVKHFFNTAVDNGTLEETIKTVKGKSGQLVRANVKAALIKSIRNGELAHVMDAVAASSELAESKPLDANFKEDLRQQARAALFEASTNGMLSKSLKKAHGTSTPDADVEPDLDNLKSKLKVKISEAAANGTLGGFLQGIAESETKAREDKQGKEDALELTFKDVPFEGLDQVAFKNQLFHGFRALGTSEATLAKFQVNLRAGSTIAEVRGPLAAIEELTVLPLSNIEVMGCKAEVTSRPMAEPKPEKADLQELRNQAQAVLVEASNNGKLFECLNEAIAEPESEKKPQGAETTRPETESRQSVRAGMLLKAIQNGEAAAALDTMPPEPPADPKTQEPDIQAIRLQAKATLMEASNNGTLAKSLDKKACAPSEPESQPTELKPQQQDVQALRLQAKATLLEAASNGTLSENLGKTACARREAENSQAGPKPEEPDIQALRKQAKATLIEASSNGTLSKSLKARAPPMPENKPAESKPQEADVQAIRLQAKASLLEAANNGTLSKNLGKKVCAPLEPENKPVEPRLQEPDIQALRKQAKDRLLEASNNGTLSTTLSKNRGTDGNSVTTQDVAETIDSLQSKNESKAITSESTPLEGSDENVLRCELMRTLSEASHTGMLAESLNEVAKREPMVQQDLASPRSHLATALLEAHKNGQLAAILQPRKQQDIEDLRKHARTVLLKGAANGTLYGALNSTSVTSEHLNELQAQQDIETLRSRSRNLLSEASRNGNLTEALCKLGKQSEPKADQADINHIRSKVSGILIEGCENGKIHEFFEHRDEASKPNDMDVLRSDLLENLTKASHTGQLAEALKEVNVQSVRARIKIALVSSIRNGALSTMMDDLAAKETSEDEKRREEHAKWMAAAMARMPDLDLNLEEPEETTVERLPTKMKTGDTQSLMASLAKVDLDGEVEEPALPEKRVDPTEIQESADLMKCSRPEPAEADNSAEHAAVEEPPLPEKQVEPADAQDSAEPMKAAIPAIRRPAEIDNTASVTVQEPPLPEKQLGPADMQESAEPMKAALPEFVETEQVVECGTAGESAEATKSEMLDSGLMQESVGAVDMENPPSILTRSHSTLVQMPTEELITTFKSEIEWRDTRIEELKKMLSSPQHRQSPGAP